MANSFVRYTGNGSTTAYAIPFTYIDSAHLACTVNGASASFTLNSAGTQATLSSVPANGSAIEFRRTSSQTTRLTDYVSGAVLTESALDTDSTQGFFMSQEAVDDANDKISLDNADFQWSAGSKRIKNITDPTSNQDAATKGYLENTWLTTANKTALTTVNANIANINAVNSNASNVNTVSANNANVTTVATNIGSVNTVATDITKVIAVANDLAEAVSEIETVADDLNETTSEIDTVSNNIANVNTVGGISSDVTTVAGISANVTTVAGNNANVTTVAGNNSNITAVATNATNINAVNANSSNINTVAGNNANVSTVAGIDSDVTGVATIASAVTAVNSNSSNINTVSGNNSNVSTVAGISGNVTTVAGIASDVTAVAGDATDIGAVAGIASAVSAVNSNSSNINAVNSNSSNINTVAANDSNITTVANANSNITAVAGNASNINTVGAAIANVNNVGGSIANVNTVAGNLASVNAFGEAYRIGSSNPTSSLDVGDLFYNTSDTTLKVYDGTGWTAGVTAGSGFLPLTGGGLTGDLTLADNVKTKFGTGNDLEIFHDGSNSKVQTATGATGDLYVAAQGSASDLYLRAEHDILIQPQGGENGIAVRGDGGVVIYNDNGFKFETDGQGANISGVLDISSKVAVAGGTDATSSDGAILTAGGISAAKKMYVGTDLTVANDATIGGDLLLGDDVKAKFGTGNDLVIYHHNNGSSYIQEVGSGDLNVLATDFRVMNASGTDNKILATSDGGVELFHDNIKKFETTSAGITVTGDTTLTGQLSLADAQMIKLGNGEDLKIYHDGSNSFVEDAGVGRLGLITNGLGIQLNAAGKQMADFKKDDAVDLFYDNNLRLQTATGGISVTGGITVTGTVDGRDVASDGSKLDGIATGATNVTNNNQLTNGAGYITSFTNTTYSAGTGLSLSGTTFNNTITNNNQLTNGAGYVTSDTNTTYSAGTGMSLSGTTFNCTIDSPSEVGLGNLSSSGNNLSGNFTATGNITAYSDERLKDNIVTIDNALDKVSQMRGVTFIKDGELSSGVIAQEMEKVAPELVVDGEYKSVAYGNTVGYLIEAIKELKAEVADLKYKKDCECE